MDIIVKGRHTEVPERFREHATSKLAKIERLDQKAIRVDVEVTEERNPRLAQHRERVELTIASRGPVVRAEASAEDRYVALDIAYSKLEARLRRASDRRKDRHTGHAGHGGNGAGAAGEAAGAGAAAGAGEGGAAGGAADDTVAAAAAADGAGVPSGEGEEVPVSMEGDGPLVVREKFHGARPMTIDQALFEMEMVGHDFFLYQDAESGLASVVYRRRGYQYGVIRLVEDGQAGDGRAGGDAALAPGAGVGKS